MTRLKNKSFSRKKRTTNRIKYCQLDGQNKNTPTQAVINIQLGKRGEAMRKSFLAVVMLFLAVKFAFAGWEMPFGLRLGVDTPETVKKVVVANGGVIKEEGNKIIKQDIVNPDIYGFKVENLNVDYLDHAMFWFYKGRLYQIEYVFPLN